MSTLKRALVWGTSSLAALSAISGGIAMATPEPETPDPPLDTASTNSADDYKKTDIVTLDVVEGTFAYTQSAVSSNEEIKNNIGASKYLCGARPATEESATSVDEWQISVGGAVAKPYTATFDDLLESEEVQQLLMGCSCAGNPADGKASANAEVTGISAYTMIGMAGTETEANTVVFTSADNYEVALPLSYIANRYCPIVFNVNGAPLAESVGGTNQLWLGSTSANYFVRDVIAITLENRETPPASPNSDEARESYGNLPNIGVLLGESVG